MFDNINQNLKYELEKSPVISQKKQPHLQFASPLKMPKKFQQQQDQQSPFTKFVNTKLSPMPLESQNIQSQPLFEMKENEDDLFAKFNESFDGFNQTQKTASHNERNSIIKRIEIPFDSENPNDNSKVTWIMFKFPTIQVNYGNKKKLIYCGQQESTPTDQEKNKKKQLSSHRTLFVSPPIKKSNSEFTLNQTNSFQTNQLFSKLMQTDEKIENKLINQNQSEQISKKIIKESLTQNKISIKTISQFPFLSNSPKEEESKHQYCRCKKTQCLKLYCECFQQRRLCDPKLCQCIGCMNIEQKKNEKEKAEKKLLERNPTAFCDDREVITDFHSNNMQLIRHKGCNCKKSGCLKKYCECYQKNQKCTIWCKCFGCQNRETFQDDENELNQEQNNLCDNLPCIDEKCSEQICLVQQNQVEKISDKKIIILEDQNKNVKEGKFIQQKQLEAVNSFSNNVLEYSSGKATTHKNTSFYSNSDELESKEQLQTNSNYEDQLLATDKVKEKSRRKFVIQQSSNCFINNLFKRKLMFEGY